MFNRSKERGANYFTQKNANRNFVPKLTFKRIKNISTFRSKFQITQMIIQEFTEIQDTTKLTKKVLTNITFSSVLVALPLHMWSSVFF